MPIHDWSRVHPAIFDAMAHYWISEIVHTLNASVLPSTHYALAQRQHSGVSPTAVGRRGAVVAVHRVGDDHLVARIEIAAWDQREGALVTCVHEGGRKTRAFVEPAGDAAVCDLPVFFQSDRYVRLPLEAAYQAAFAAMPRRWKSVLK